MIEINLMRKNSRLGLRSSLEKENPREEQSRGIVGWIVKNLRQCLSSTNAQVAGGYLGGNTCPYAGVLSSPSTPQKKRSCGPKTAQTSPNTTSTGTEIKGSTTLTKNV